MFIRWLHLSFHYKAYHTHYYCPFFESTDESTLTIAVEKCFIFPFQLESSISIVKLCLMYVYSAQSAHCKILLYQCGFCLITENWSLDWMYILLIPFLTFLCKASSIFWDFDACGKQYLLVRTNFTFTFNCESFGCYESIQLVFFEIGSFGKAYLRWLTLHWARISFCELQLLFSLIFRWFFCLNLNQVLNVVLNWVDFKKTKWLFCWNLIFWKGLRIWQ